MFIMDGASFFRGVRRGLGNFPKKNDAQQKLKIKSCEWNPGEKHPASASSIISWIFYVKKILARAIAHQNNCAQPKCEE